MYLFFSSIKAQQALKIVAADLHVPVYHVVVCVMSQEPKINPLAANVGSHADVYKSCKSLCFYLSLNGFKFF